MKDDHFYDMVAAEIFDGSVNPGLWAKAFAGAKGNADLAQADYIKYRVAQLRAEAKRVMEQVALAKRMEVDAERRTARLSVAQGCFAWLAALLAVVVCVGAFAFLWQAFSGAGREAGGVVFLVLGLVLSILGFYLVRYAAKL
ncbi:MAG: hypothetical protein KDK97_09340 [Verrucomicrobiales bacterium]|nr:hypothetical protein [Verrucomicrobiales bacterium]MCP5558908.1 hypothetical protein [Verrucomicrobiaceae bacterium]